MNLSTYDLGTRVTNTVFSLTKPKIFPYGLWWDWILFKLKAQLLIKALSKSPISLYNLLKKYILTNKMQSIMLLIDSSCSLYTNREIQVIS